MVKTIEVRIPADGEIELGARLFIPEEKGLRPAITMAHGFAGPTRMVLTVSRMPLLRRASSC